MRLKRCGLLLSVSIVVVLLAMAPASVEEADDVATTAQAATPSSRPTTTTAPTSAPTSCPTTTTAPTFASTSRPTTTTATANGLVVSVPGNLALLDLGPVQAETVYTVIFAVENLGEQPIAIRRIVPDCECIYAVDPPSELAAGMTTNVIAMFEVPRVSDLYGSELIVMTADPDRRIIHLRILCRVVK